MSSADLSLLRQRINQHYLADDSIVIEQLCAGLKRYDAGTSSVAAEHLIAAIRTQKRGLSLIDSFLHEYRLDSAEGVVLMSIAEALLRIPDSETQDRLLQDKLSAKLWDEAKHGEESFLVSLSHHALQLAGTLEQHIQQPGKIYRSVFARLGAPLIRSAIKQAMQLLAYQFVIAENIDDALRHADHHYLYSFDMLGEAALTQEDAERYFQAYFDAISALSKHALHPDVFENPSISIKLSALYPRYEPLQHRHAEHYLSDRLLSLVHHAYNANIGVTIDAEESERLEMSLNIFETVFRAQRLKNWPGFGLALQAYQKRALATIRWLAALAESEHKPIPLRLVKGAYWDSEIKRAQENGLSDYPVFTHKSATDISYLACAELILDHAHVFYPQFATHNAHTLCAIREMADDQFYEFQRLHGMGEALYDYLIKTEESIPRCRIYAPVGSYRELLPYLVRRLLENGANTSFVNQIETPDIATDLLSRDPLAVYQALSPDDSLLKRPPELFGPQRMNSVGLNLADSALVKSIQQQLNSLAERHWQAAPLIDGEVYDGKKRITYCCTNRKFSLGTVIAADEQAIQAALQSAADSFSSWRLCPVAERAKALLKTADLLEQHKMELVSLCIREGGRSLKDALNEVREAVDFCRYYAAMAQASFGQPIHLPGPTGESNQLVYFGRGVFACISPWNFPVAIFIGQVTAALAAGNCVIAKPANQTPLTGMYCVQLLHRAGIPQNVLHFLPGDGAKIGKTLLSDPRIAGVAFTGSTTTARLINKQLAKLPVIVPFIAETGGQNVMIADSSAHCQQLVLDVIASSFNSAGQRCSALRVLYLQQEIADQVIDMLTGAMRQLVIGPTNHYATDIGPVIDDNARQRLAKHVAAMREQATVLYQLPLPARCDEGCFFPPTLIEIQSLKQLKEEVFGPILHIIRYKAGELQSVIDDVNRCGYGLTLGIQSRIQQTVDTIQRQIKVGNIYVNRNMVGAVVGVQPFGGMGLSGTGPKAGGPNYLQRFVVEQTVTVNTAALGGNVGLLSKQLF